LMQVPHPLLSASVDAGVDSFCTAMLARLFGSSTPQEPANPMYYDEERRRWRQRGMEHLEEEEEELPPPPMAKEKKPEGCCDTQAASNASRKEATGLDALMAPPPNPYANMLQKKPAPKVSVLPPVGAFRMEAPAPVAPPTERGNNTNKAGVAEVSHGPTAEREAKHGGIHDQSVGIAAPEPVKKERNTDDGAAEQKDIATASMTEKNDLNEVEVICGIAPVQGGSEEATRDITLSQESKPDSDLIAEDRMKESSGPKAPEPDVSLTNEELPAVPAARIVANGPASSSMASADVIDVKAARESIGQSGANFASLSPVLHTDDKDHMARLAESPNATYAAPAGSEPVVATLRLSVAGLEQELEKEKRKASACEEQLLVVQKAHEELLHKLEADGAESKDLFQVTQKAKEEQLHMLKAQVVELRRELEAERTRSGASAEAVASTTVSLSEDCKLPDFVQTCGNHKVIEFARRLATDNAALRRQQQQQQQQQQQAQPLQQQAASTSAKETIASLLALLQERHNDFKMSMKVCSALETLTFKTSENRVTLVKHGGVKAIVDLLEEHKDASGALLRPAVDTLWNLMFEDVAVDAAADVGAIERILAMMQMHFSEASLIIGACAILLNLSVRAQNRWKIVESGGVDIMASAMQYHSENEEVMEVASQALWMLAYHQDLKLMLLASHDSVALAAACSHRGKAQMWGLLLQEELAC